MNEQSVAIFWFRRDLRLEDNAGLYHALKENENVLPLFIFDREILDRLPTEDRRVPFIYSQIQRLKSELKKNKSDLWIEYGKPLESFNKILKKHKVHSVYTNHDYEPSAVTRDVQIQKLCDHYGIEFKSFKDHVIFEKSEILNGSNKPYTVYTPYKKKWLASLKPFYIKSYPTQKYFKHFFKFSHLFKFNLTKMGFTEKADHYPVSQVSLSIIKNYAKNRDYPFLHHGTTHLGLHFRFGTVSIREQVRLAKKHSAVWLSELIWRDFFIQVLWHFPHSESRNFKPQYDGIQWRKNKKDFEAWKNGKTGYPMVDAGMRELNTTGFMHNRVRMVAASFLTKHLLHFWKQGERYFAEKLLDYDLAANVGNWQWAAGTGCDAAPYFRIFNPESQQKRFDPDMKYIKKWVPEFVAPIVDHEEARKRALFEYKKGLNR